MTLMKKALGILLLALVLVSAAATYLEDGKTVEQALEVERYVIDYCKKRDRYPSNDTFRQIFPALSPDKGWYYWPSEDLKNATLQYPMSLPLPNAPGRSKFSEFVPIIYAYAVRNPCTL